MLSVNPPERIKIAKLLSLPAYPDIIGVGRA